MILPSTPIPYKIIESPNLYFTTKMAQANFLNTLSRDTTNTIAMMLQPSTVYLIYYGAYSDRLVEGISYSFDDAVEFMLTLMSTDRSNVNCDHNKYNRETKTWTYAIPNQDCPRYFDNFDIEEWNTVNTNILRLVKTYSINYDKHLSLIDRKFVADSRLLSVLPNPPESFINFDKTRMLVYD